MTPAFTLSERLINKVIVLFKVTLEKLIASVEGAYGAAVMNRFGVIVESVAVDEDAARYMHALPELGPVYEQIDALRELVNFGQYRSLSFRTEQLLILMRPLTTDYIALLCLAPDAIVGRAKFKLRVAAPSLTAEL